MGLPFRCLILWVVCQALAVVEVGGFQVLAILYYYYISCIIGELFLVVE
jgi:hypothetical protein